MEDKATGLGYALPGDFREQAEKRLIPSKGKRLPAKPFWRRNRRGEPHGSGIVDVRCIAENGRPYTRRMARSMPPGWDERRVEVSRSLRERQRAATVEVNRHIVDHNRVGAPMRNQYERALADMPAPNAAGLARTRAMVRAEPVVELAKVRKVDARIAKLTKQIESARTHERKRELRIKRAALLREQA
ncbi:MAG: hypothetical protein ACYTEQ_25245 [Planctomycetota bacterium]